MNWAAFRTETTGKWVLTGEHSVLRGGTALALPLIDRRLHFSFYPGHSLQIHPEEARKPVLDLLCSLEEYCRKNDLSFSMPEGTITIQSEIPFGAGLGSSAALCVALVRWFSQQTPLTPEHTFTLARALEDTFHGQSSGMDVAVILAGEPISFSMQGGTRTLHIRHLPRFSLHDTGLRARTSDCIEQVQRLRNSNPTAAIAADETMAQASRKATEGLLLYDSGNHKSGLNILAEAINLAQSCFDQWDLVPAQARTLQTKLLAEGAKAVKMTGAGGGGMVVALWES